MIRMALAALGVTFWLGFYAGAHLNGVACGVIHGPRAPLAWINC